MTHTASELLSSFLGDAGAAQEKVLRLLIELAAQFVGADEGSILLLDASGKHLVFVMTAGDRESEKMLVGQKVPVGRGITGLAAQTQEVHIGAPTYKQVRQARSGGPDGAPLSVMAAPLLIDEDLIGVITAATFNPNKRFTGNDARLYGRIASVIAVVIDQAHRLETRSAAGKRKSPPKALTGQERTKRELAVIVSRLSTLPRDRLAKVVRLLSLLEESVFSR